MFRMGVRLFLGPFALARGVPLVVFGRPVSGRLPGVLLHLSGRCSKTPVVGSVQPGPVSRHRIPGTWYSIRDVQYNLLFFVGVVTVVFVYRTISTISGWSITPTIWTVWRKNTNGQYRNDSRPNSIRIEPRADIPVDSSAVSIIRAHFATDRLNNDVVWDIVWDFDPLRIIQFLHYNRPPVYSHNRIRRAYYYRNNINNNN